MLRHVPWLCQNAWLILADWLCLTRLSVVDAQCGSFYTGHVNDAVAAKILPQSDVDTALERIWTQAFALGLVDPASAENPYRNLSQFGPSQVDTPASRALALEAAEQSMVLMKNEGALLPLKLSTRIAMIGPNLNVTCAHVLIQPLAHSDFSHPLTPARLPAACFLQERDVIDLRQ